MKISTLLLIFGSLLLTVSCSTDAVETDDLSGLYGTYKLTELRSNDPSEFNYGGVASYNLIEALPCLEVITVIKEDHTYETIAVELVTSTDPVSKGYTYACGNEAFIKRGTWNMYDGQVVMGNATFEIVGNQLIDERDPELEWFDRLIHTKLEEY
ncbi:hypothetical protein PP178_07405 [Zeaxanthinibacter sp. PT1]|uniref:hypothetical protein n=1 Tax=Zeaxanthinibacter TaxID=561554 RepID=UPI00234AE00A|nr:hypothetical protein [Zeaxanthinibacter sp. PT1]MDC6351375.1 hypothetical protein [Zeaxanthinibacter sp. PT1]